MGQAEDWARTWSASIGANVFRLRDAKGLSAQALSSRCNELGYPIPRSTIANLETSRRTVVPVQDIAVLAAALETTPIALLFNVRESGHSILPNRTDSPADAAGWFAGSWPLDDGQFPYSSRLADNDDEQDSETSLLWQFMSARYDQNALVHYVQLRDEALIQLSAAERSALAQSHKERSLARHPSQRNTATPEYWNTELRFNSDMVDSLAESLVKTRKEILALGVEPPPLSKAAALALQEMQDDGA